MARGVPWHAVPHHDGSPDYVPEPPTELGQDFDVFLRVPASSDLQRVAVRHIHDGEPVSVEAWLDRTDAYGNRWFRATLTQANPVTRYRFLTDGGPLGYQWITAAGPRDADVPDGGDFVSSIYRGGPDWLDGAIAYQIFPDRFANSGRVREPAPDWAVPRPWTSDPVPPGREGSRALYGGDLYGVAAHLDHVAAVGANLLYLTPVFPAESTHRYNAATFDHVDPLLGGDEAYRALIAAAHARGMHVIGDLTTNHTGSSHEWFTAAQQDSEGGAAGFYYFTEHPDTYAGWMGHPGLPKLNYDNPEVLQELVTGPLAPIRRYLRDDFGLDGWRIDVANMTGRYGAIDRNHEVARAVRATVYGERPDAYLVGEHFHDFLSDLDGSGWQGVMNYAGFTKPIWSWLVRDGLPLDNWMGVPRAGWPQLPAWSALETINAFSSVAWQHRRASMNIISSHDSPRIRTVTGDPALVEVAAAAMFTMPGVPMIWSGDEIGLEGISGEAGRLPFPWHRPDQWHSGTLEVYRALARLRSELPALRRGSLRWLYADDDRLLFVRELAGEQVLVLLARRAGEQIQLPTEALGLQDGQKFDSLYPMSTTPVLDDHRSLPTDGPGAWIWFAGPRSK